MTSTSPDWTILVPVKDTARGKSRIQLPAGLRRELALAMATDTVRAAAQCGTVMAIVESESDGAALATVAGVLIHRTSVTGLNESILDGLKARSRLAIALLSERVAVLPGDLPGLQPADLRAALAQCATHPFSFVADHQGSGTTLLAATEQGVLQPRYGPGSRDRHELAGAVPIEVPQDSSLRWDVDTVADMDTGLGPRTRAVLAGVPRRQDR